MAKTKVKAVIAAKAGTMSGAEPDCSGIDFTAPDYTINLMKCLNWYSKEKDRKEAYRYIKEYVKLNRKTDLQDFVKKVTEKDIQISLGWIARMEQKGAKLSIEHSLMLTSHINELLLKEEVEEATEEPAKKNVINIQDAIKEKAMEFLGELEGKLDDYVTKRETTNLLDFLKAQQVPAPYMPYVQDWAKAKLVEILAVIDQLNDPDYKDAYSHFNKRDIVAYAKMLGTFVEDCDKYTLYKKANRKPRPVREKTPAQQVKGLKFKITDEESGLKSVSPTDIIGAQQLWVYNTKTRKLALYKTDSARGIQCKGSTLQNYEPEVSVQKTLRKPAEQLKALMEAGKIQLRKFMDEIGTKGQNVNGRINAEMLLLKVVK
jgi:hypothetical protein